MYEIIPNLFLSAYHAVEVTDDTFIVNCTKDLKMKSDSNLRIAVNDDMSREALHGMLLALPDAVDTIHEQLQNNKRVVIHCLAGQQRSPTVIAAYLFKKCGYTLEDAITYIRGKKKDAFFWSVNFRDSLEKFIMMQ
jgi:dual specificity MAP kinase phosphatase